MANQAIVAAQPAKMEVAYQAGGQDVKLNAQMVRNYLTKGNGHVTDQEVMQFICICKYQQLNPFLNEAYIVKFANNRGGEDNATIIVSKEALMKRAEGCDGYRGFKAGLILKRGTEVVYQEGEFMLDGDVLLGGWAEVYRKDREYPAKAYVNLKDYDKGRSTWNAIKCTMIRKVALVHALREAFPTQLGALYTSDEQRLPAEDTHYEEVTEQHIQAEANSIELPEEAPEEPANEPANEPATPTATTIEVPSIFD